MNESGVDPSVDQGKPRARGLGGWADPNVPKCGAKTRAGTPCKKAAMENGRCRLHGGLALRGIAAPQFKTGRYSKYLPSRLADRFDESLKDPNLLELKSEIALTDARLEDLLKRVDTGEAGLLWSMAGAALEELRTGFGKGKAEDVYSSMAKLEAAIGRGTNDYLAWDEVLKLMEHRRRLVESERKRLVEIQGVITVDRAMVLIGSISGIIRQYVTDRKVLNQIAVAISALINKKESEDVVSIERID